MAERTQVTEVVQLGVETTPGTLVAANRQLPTLKMNPGVDGSFTNVRPSGNKFTTLNVLGKEWSTASASMDAVTFDEMTYILASVLGKVNASQLGGTAAYSWDFSPNAIAGDNPQTFTFETGSAVAANKFGHGVISAFTLTGDRDKVGFSGSIMGQRFTSGIALTANPTPIPLVPVKPSTFDIYMDSTSAALGTTKLGRAFSWEIGVNNRYSPLWVVDSAQSSYATIYEVPIEGTLKLSLEADTVGMNFLNEMRSGATRFCRIKATDPLLAGIGNPYSMQWDMALQVAETPKQFGDADGIVSIDWTFNIVYDSAWTRAMRCLLVNKVALL